MALFKLKANPVRNHSTLSMINSKISQFPFAPSPIGFNSKPKRTQQRTHQVSLNSFSAQLFSCLNKKQQGNCAIQQNNCNKQIVVYQVTVSCKSFPSSRGMLLNNKSELKCYSEQFSVNKHALSEQSTQMGRLVKHISPGNLALMAQLMAQLSRKPSEKSWRS